MATTILLAGAFHVIMGISGISACAQGRLEARYEITMTRVPIGYIAWQVDIGNDFYAASADGKASRILSVLMNGEASILASGRIENGKLTPTLFRSSIIDEDGKTELQVIFAAGIAKESISRQPLKRHELVPLADADRIGVTDPISAMLIPAIAHNGVLQPEDCNRMLPIFDGQRRYNFVLTYNRMDKFKIARGYSGLALVCSAVLQPVGGYRTDSLVVKYIAGRHDIEFWFAPIAGTFVLAPIRILVPTLIGTMRIQAEQFDAVAGPVLNGLTPPKELPR